MYKSLSISTLALLMTFSGLSQTPTNKIESTGDVGIGTTAPITKLEAKGTIFSSNLANDAGVYLTSDDGSYGLVQATNNYAINSVPKNLILQKYGGNVGIGSTFAPLSLTVGTPHANDGLRIGGGTYHLDIMSNMWGGGLQSPCPVKRHWPYFQREQSWFFWRFGHCAMGKCYWWSSNGQYWQNWDRH